MQTSKIRSQPTRWLLRVHYMFAIVESVGTCIIQPYTAGDATLALMVAGKHGVRLLLRVLLARLAEKSTRHVFVHVAPCTRIRRATMISAAGANQSSARVTAECWHK